MSRSLLFSEPPYFPTLEANIVYSKPGESSSTTLDSSKFRNVLDGLDSDVHQSRYRISDDRPTPEISTGFSLNASLPSSPATPESSSMLNNEFNVNVNVFDNNQALAPSSHSGYYTDNLTTIVSPTTIQVGDTGSPIDALLNSSGLFTRWDPVPAYATHSKADAGGPLSSTFSGREPLRIAVNIAVDHIWRISSPVDADSIVNSLTQLYDDSGRDQELLLILKEECTKAFKDAWVNTNDTCLLSSHEYTFYAKNRHYLSDSAIITRDPGLQRKFAATDRLIGAAVLIGLMVQSNLANGNDVYLCLGLLNKAIERECAVLVFYVLLRAAGDKVCRVDSCAAIVSQIDELERSAARLKHFRSDMATIVPTLRSLLAKYVKEQEEKRERCKPRRRRRQRPSH